MCLPSLLPRRRDGVLQNALFWSQCTPRTRLGGIVGNGYLDASFRWPEFKSVSPAGEGSDSSRCVTPPITFPVFLYHHCCCCESSTSPLSFLPLPLLSSLSLQPLYTQPWEAPGYFNIIARYTKPLIQSFRKLHAFWFGVCRHRHFRSKLVQLIGRQKRERHEKVVHIPLPLLPPQTSSLAHTSLPPGRTCCCVRGTMTTRRSGRRDWTRLRTAPRESNRLRLPLTETTTSSASCLSCLSLSLLQSKRLEEQRAV